MGRLFWKFFLSLWLAQILTVAAVGVAIRVSHHGEGPPRFAPRPPPVGVSGAMRPPPPPPRWAVPMLPIAAGGVISLLFAWLLAWSFAKPIGTLRMAFDSVARGRLQTRVGSAMASRKDELSHLGMAFDRMAERLQRLLESERRMLHDVSHELRSPLARLQAATELMHQQPARAPECIGRIERDVARLDRLVGEILTVARMDAGIIESMDERIDVADMLGDVCDDARFEAGERGCTIALRIASGLTVIGNAELLRRAIENVVRNAMQHAPDHSPVEIAADASNDGSVRIAINDRGPGVAPAELESIFDPYFRSDRRTAGMGLGLAIARGIVGTHGGRIWAANLPGGGLQVTIELPAAEAPRGA